MEIKLQRIEYNGINSIYTLNALSVTNVSDETGKILLYAFYPKTNKLIVFNEYNNIIVKYIK
jgi:hypothetical protein